MSAERTDVGVTLGEVLHLARVFDELSGPQLYTAVEFVTWLRLEISLGEHRPYNAPAGRPGKMTRGRVA